MKIKKILPAFFSTLMFSASSQAVELRGEQVVVLHGIARSSSHMEPVANMLEQKGFTVYNLDYPSTKYPLEQLASIVASDISQKIRADQPVHFVGYSMGGIVTRIILNKYRPDNLGRVVQLASPNNGSEIADFLKTNPLYETIYGPAGQQLITEGAGIDELLGDVDYELGVIAGNFSIDPVSSSIIPGDDDGKVSIESTKVKGMRDHIIVSASHTFFPSNQEVLTNTLNFLRFGAFRP